KTDVRVTDHDLSGRRYKGKPSARAVINAAVSVRDDVWDAFGHRHHPDQTIRDVHYALAHAFPGLHREASCLHRTRYRLSTTDLRLPYPLLQLLSATGNRRQREIWDETGRT